jgi:subtilisin family serine protease
MIDHEAALRLGRLAALLLGLSSPALAQEGVIESAGQPVTVRVVQDLIAVDAAAGTVRGSSREVYDLAAGLSNKESVQIADLSESGYVVLKARRGRREQLSELVSRGAGEQDAGVVVEIGSAKTPSGRPPVAIMTSEFIVKFRPGVTRAHVDQLNAAHKVSVRTVGPSDPSMYLLRLENGTPGDVLSVCQKYLAEKLLVDGLAHPNFVYPAKVRGQADPLSNLQWHLDTAHVREAWRHTKGKGTIIAVIDPDGVEVKHEDLVLNRFKNISEVADNGVDDDKNGYVDDISGWNFAVQSDNPLTGRAHGTSAAGVAAARCENGVGVCGVAPEAQVLGIARGRTVKDDADAIDYAVRMGASVISNSWGYEAGLPITQAVERAVANAIARGVVVVFAMTNEKRDNFGGEPGGYRDIAALPGVVSVGRATDADVWGESGFGQGMVVLAPSGAAVATRDRQCVADRLAGVNEITTLDLSGDSGSNLGGVCRCNSSRTEIANKSYTSCFAGTSAAAPVVAGVVALMRAINPKLSPSEVSEILAMTSDRIDAGAARYGMVNGLQYSVTHGYGRVNASAAVDEVRRRLNDSSRSPDQSQGTATAVASSLRQPGSEFTMLAVPMYGDVMRAQMRRGAVALLFKPSANQSAVRAKLANLTIPAGSVGLDGPSAELCVVIPEDALGAVKAAVGQEEFEASARLGTVPNGGVWLLVNRFSGRLAPGRQIQDVVKASDQAGLRSQVALEADGGEITVRALDVFTLPDAMLALASALQVDGVLSAASIAFEWVPPVQRRGASLLREDQGE